MSQQAKRYKFCYQINTILLIQSSSIPKENDKWFPEMLNQVWNQTIVNYKQVEWFHRSHSWKQNYISHVTLFKVFKFQFYGGIYGLMCMIPYVTTEKSIYSMFVANRAYANSSNPSKCL